VKDARGFIISKGDTIAIAQRGGSSVWQGVYSVMDVTLTRIQFQGATRPHFTSASRAVVVVQGAAGVDAENGTPAPKKSSSRREGRAVTPLAGAIYGAERFGHLAACTPRTAEVAGWVAARPGKNAAWYAKQVDGDSQSGYRSLYTARDLGFIRQRGNKFYPVALRCPEQGHQDEQNNSPPVPPVEIDEAGGPA
jgi:hypothetical protein